MKGSVTVSVKFNKFGDIARRMPERAETAVTKAAHDIIAGAAPHTPIEFGGLINSAAVGGSGVAKWVTWSVFYAMYQNSGTRFIAGNFFAEKGVAYAKPGFIQALKEMASEL